jgi:threonine dehydrogenase-like Zn-dependent dehydrogenase
MTTSRAAVLVGPGRLEYQDIRHSPAHDQWALLAVESCGLCGTDAEQFSGHFTGSMWGDRPLIPGHEIIGVIERLSEGLAGQGLAVGDRVAVEPNIPCGRCDLCLNGRYVSCTGWPVRPFSHGFIPTTEAPGLWGGYAEHMYLHPNTVVHRVPDELTAGEASIFNAVATGFEWAVRAPRISFGQSVLVLGAGQRGLASLAASKAAGAGVVAMTGTANDHLRLRAAESLGVDLAVQVDSSGAEDELLAVTRGAGFDIVIDTSAGAVEPIETAVRLVRDQGTIVLAGLKGGRRAALDVDSAVLKGVNMIGVRSASFDAYEQALSYLAGDRRLCELRTHVYSLDQAADALEALSSAPPERMYVGIDVVS